MSDLTNFLLARITEDEDANRDEHAPDAVHANDCSIHPQGLEETWCDCDEPARVLAECAAKRQVVEAYREMRGVASQMDHANDPAVSTARNMYAGIHLAIQCLATSYAEHADYRQEWKL